MVKRIFCFFICLMIIDTVLAMDESDIIVKGYLDSAEDENKLLVTISEIGTDFKKVEELLYSPDLNFYLRSNNLNLISKLYKLFTDYNNQLSTESTINFTLSKVLLTLNSVINQRKKQIMPSLDKPVQTIPTKKTVEGFVMLNSSPESSDDEDLSLYDTLYLSKEAIEKNENLIRFVSVNNELEAEYQGLTHNVAKLLDLERDTRMIASSYEDDAAIKRVIDQNIAVIEEQCNQSKSNLDKTMRNLEQLTIDKRDCEFDLDRIKSILQAKIDKRWKEAQQLASEKKNLANRNGMLSAHVQLLQKEINEAEALQVVLAEDEKKFKQKEAALLTKLERIRKATFALGTIAASQDIRSGVFQINNDNLKQL